MAKITEDDETQLEMYLSVKNLVKSGRITLLQSTETNGKIKITIELDKNRKTIEKVRQEYDSGYGYR